MAEIGGNHGGDPALAGRMVRAAREAGAGAVKFQAYCTADFISSQSPYYEELATEELPFEQLGDLVAQAQKLGLAAGLTVFDREGLALAREAGADFIKISSGDLTNTDLLRLAAEAGRPLFVSTGAAEEAEVARALALLAPARDQLVLLQCASLYPAPPEAANLAVMVNWLAAGLAAGYSDHTLGLEVAEMAITLGAVALEKHFTLNRGLPGGDNRISAQPEDLRQLARWAELSRQALGEAVKAPHPLESPIRPVIRRAVVAAGHLPAGHRLAPADLALRRPPPTAGPLLGPDDLAGLASRVLTTSLTPGEAVTWAAVSGGPAGGADG
ncbi:MAG: N-acetylneuraminate synthase family protein [Candidatus Adiutrix sp.]|nr:N-acetylneuraminate synthase family protein [Candidatus Adiutrix sp.]